MGAKCEACQHEHENWVPAERLSKATQDRKAAETARDEALAQVAEAVKAAARVAELEGTLATLTSERDRLTLTQGIMQAGITDAEGVAVVSTLWAALPEDARPSEGLTGWLTSSAAPRAVRAYLPPPPGEAPPPAAAAPPAAPKPPSQAGVAAVPPPAGTLSAQQLAAMSPTEYAAAKKQGWVGQVLTSLQAARAGQG